MIFLTQKVYFSRLMRLYLDLIVLCLVFSWRHGVIRLLQILVGLALYLQDTYISSQDKKYCREIFLSVCKGTQLQ